MICKYDKIEDMKFAYSQTSALPWIYRKHVNSVAAMKDAIQLG